MSNYTPNFTEFKYQITKILDENGTLTWNVGNKTVCRCPICKHDNNRKAGHNCIVNESENNIYCLSEKKSYTGKELAELLGLKGKFESKPTLKPIPIQTPPKPVKQEQKRYDYDYVVKKMQEQNFALKAKYTYRLLDNTIYYHNCRFQNQSDKNKKFVLFDVDNKTRLVNKKKIIYNLQQLKCTENNNKEVWISEGEKCTEILQEKRDITVSFTALGYNSKSDFINANEINPIFEKYFKDRVVRIFVDNDIVGIKNTLELIQLFKQYTSKIYIIDFAEFTEKYDVADFLEQHSFSELLEKIKNSMSADEFIEIQTKKEEEDMEIVVDNTKQIELIKQVELLKKNKFELMHAENVKKHIENKRADMAEQWLLKNLIREKTRTILHAAGGSGKSFLALQLAASYILQENFLIKDLEWKKYRYKKVVYLTVNDENSIEDFHNRFNLIAKQTENDFSDEQIEFFWNNFIHLETDNLVYQKNSRELDVTDEFLQLKEFVEKQNVELMIIDPLIAFLNGDLNDNSAVYNFFRILKKIDTTFLIVHHQPKATYNANIEDKTARGASAIQDNSRCVLTIQKLKGTDYIDLYIAKQNNSKLMDKHLILTKPPFAAIKPEFMDKEEVDKFIKPKTKEPEEEEYQF